MPLGRKRMPHLPPGKAGTRLWEHPAAFQKPLRLSGKPFPGPLVSCGSAGLRASVFPLGVLLNAFETTGRQFRNQAALPETHLVSIRGRPFGKPAYRLRIQGIKFCCCCARLPEKGTH